MKFFENDIKIVKKFFNSIGFDFDEDFRFDVFKEFIYAAAGMFKDLDTTIYNQELITKFKTIRYLNDRFTEFEQRSQYALNIYLKDFLNAQDAYMGEKHKFEILKAELQMFISREQTLAERRKVMEAQFIDKEKPIPADKRDAFEQDLKKVRRDHVDTIHMIGTHRRDLEELQEGLKVFEEQHKEEFFRYFNEIKEKLTHQYTESLNYFGFDFNEALFKNSERSGPIQRFKKESGIEGNLDLCKYVEYYLRNVIPEALADKRHTERLLNAKRFCERKNKR
ncbi:MAG: hypothetical protein PHW64_08615 [Sulfuricurvum sp.]|nr:hypothetical protein [Sulfuricurvum sp.]